MLRTWLQVVTDKAMSCAWTNVLTIKGKLLTDRYADIERRQEYAQEYQDEGRRCAQNEEMLLQCLKASISKAVYSRIYQLRHNYTMIREPEKHQVQNGMHYLKTIINCYHVNNKSSNS